jgi:hypothetical protein
MGVETEIQKEGLDLCNAHPNVTCMYRTQSGRVKVKGGWMQLCPAGTPDTTGMMANGKMIGIEYKTPEEYRTKHHGASTDQLDKLNDIKDAGGYAGIACNMEHVIEILEGKYVGL